MSLAALSIQEILQRIPSGYKSAEDEFFVVANKALLPEFKKLGIITNEEHNEEITSSGTSPIDIDCNVPGCLHTFKNVHDYQSHYNTVHRFLCSTCKRILPTPHLLDLHISETHDSFFQARVDRGDPMYACYLEECESVASTPAERKEHCIKTHNFPANFRFDQIANKKFSNKMEVDMPEGADAAKKVAAFTFGHNSDRSFNKRCTRRPAGATLENLNDLKDALEQ